MPEKKGRLKPEDEKKIRSNFCALKDEIDGNDFVDFLYQEKVFSTDDIEDMKALKTRLERADFLLISLLQSDPGKSYDCFIKILNEKYPTLAKRLEETSIENCDSKSYYSWFDSVPKRKKEYTITQADTFKLSDCFDDNWPNIFCHLDFCSGEIEQEYIKHQHDSRAEIMSLLMKKKGNKDFTLKDVVEALKKVEDAAVCFIKWDAVQKFVDDIKI